MTGIKGPMLGPIGKTSERFSLGSVGCLSFGARSPNFGCCWVHLPAYPGVLSSDVFLEGWLLARMPILLMCLCLTLREPFKAITRRKTIVDFVDKFLRKPSRAMNERCDEACNLGSHCELWVTPCFENCKP